MNHLSKILWISLAVKLVLAALLPLTSDEAYYWVWSQNMQLSFYDHPPFVAWLYWLGEAFHRFGGMVRWPGVFLGHAGLALWLHLLKPYLSEDQRRLWLWLMLLCPLTGGSAILVTPDLPLMFFYPVALWAFVRWRDMRSWPWALALGLAVGLGFTSKYMMVLFVISLLPFVLMARELRILFLKHLPLILLGGLAGTWPVWVWNLMHDFASIKFQAEHGLGRSWKPSWTWHYIAAQIGLIFPVILYWALRARSRVPRWFQWLAWTPLVFFLMTTSRGYVEANWPIAAYPAVFVLAVSWFPVNARGLRFTAGLWALALSAFAAVVILRPSWSRPMKFREFFQFDEVVTKLQTLGPEPVFARSYQMAAKLHFELRRPIYKLKGFNRRDFYDYLHESRPTGPVYYWVAEVNDVFPKEYSDRGDRVVETVPIDGTFELRKVEVP